MNVVERESEIESSPENGSTLDPSTPRKSSSKTGVITSAQRVNLLPSLRGAQPSQRVHIRRYVAERAQELQSFIAPLEASVRQAYRLRARKYRGSVKAQANVAELVLATIRRIAQRETGVFNLNVPVPQLVSALFAGSVEVGIIGGLVRRAQKALALRDALQREQGRLGGSTLPVARGLSYDVGRELDELRMLLTWYVKRKTSLAALECDPVTELPFELESSADRDERDALFGFEVMHDHHVFGTKGCLVTCGLRLVGRDGQALWLRVSVMSEGRAVSARSAWLSWTDPGDSSPVQLLDAHGAFCSLVPIRPNAQRLVIDEIRAFIPYAALNLGEGRQQVEIVVSVVDNDGSEILTVTRPESVCVPHSELATAVVPAPHSVGMWPHDVVSGDKISEFGVSSGFKMVGGWERHSISVQFDLSLFMHAGESVTLECRFVNAHGNVVELSSLGIPFVASEANVAVESLSSYRYRRVLHPKGAWALYQGLCIDIPVEFLLLEPGNHDITCELVIVSPDERVLCGDMSRVQVHVPVREQKNQAIESDDSAEAAEVPHVAHFEHAVIELESIEVDAAWDFGAEESIRVQARFRPHSSSSQLADLAAGRLGELVAPYRVEVSIEREDGHVLLQAFTDSMGMSLKPVTRAVCVDTNSGFSEHSVVANFNKHEVLGWSLTNPVTRSGAKARLFARVAAYSPRGDLLVSEHKEFFVKPIAGGGKNVVKVGEVAPMIVDALVLGNRQSARVAARAVINIPPGDFSEEGVFVRFTLCSPDGRRVSFGDREISFSNEGLWTRQISGLTQSSVEADCLLEGQPDGEISPSVQRVEIALMSASGEQLSVVEQQITFSGVLTEVRDDEQGDEGESRTWDETPGVSAVSAEEVAQTDRARRGFLRRLFSK